MLDIAHARERLEIIEALLDQHCVNFEPQPPCWMTDDASESYCADHVVAERAKSIPIPDGYDLPWFRRSKEQSEAVENFSAGFECGSYALESDNSEACTVCGKLLAYTLTDYGQRAEIDHFLSVQWHGIGLDIEVAYEVARAISHIAASQDESLVRDALSVAEAAIARLSFTY